MAGTQFTILFGAPLREAALRGAILAVGLVGVVSSAGAAPRVFEDGPPAVFPPVPPPAGVRVVLPAGASIGASNPAPLQIHVLDPFFAPFSIRLIARNFTREVWAEYNDFRALRLGLLEELRDHLARISRLDSRARLAANEAFAQLQSGRIDRLEALAEQLREDLIRDVPAQFEGNWGACRRWRLGNGQLQDRAGTRSFEMRVMRAAAYFQEGLCPAQRRLLREIAIQLEDEIFRRDTSARDAGLFFFEPDTIRVRLPFESWPEVEAMIADYSALKDRLKGEIRNAVYDEDNNLIELSRRHALRKLARQQEPMFEELERRAEAVRREMARRHPVGMAVMPAALPPRLDRLIAEFQLLRGEIDREVQRRVDRIVRDRASERPADPDEQVDWDNETRRLTRVAQAEHREEQSMLWACLVDLVDQIRVELEGFAGRDATIGQGPFTDSFIDEFLEDRRLQGGQAEYSVAVFEPGLSPGQRRLLAGAALADSGLLMPAPEVCPTVLPRTILK